MNRLARLQPFLPFLLALLFLLPRLGGAPLFDVDEGAFSEATREMLAKGDYLSTWLNGRPRFDKPILIYWLQALSVAAFGVTEWAFRLPSVLAAAGWCAVLARFARKYLGTEAGWMAGVVALSCLGVQLIGRAATADALLNFLLALALVDLWRFIAENSRWAGRRLALWVGLGVLTKGPIALLVPGAALVLWSLSYRRADPLLNLARDPVAWVLFLVSWVPWYLAAYAIHGDLFIQGFIMRHNVKRFTGTLEGHSGSMLYYLLLVPLFVFPWLGWLGSALANVRRGWSDPLRRFLWLWVGFVIVFFSFSGTKLPHYALYGCTPLFVLIAAEWQQRRSLLNALPALMLLALYAAVPSILARIHVTDPFYAEQFARLESVVPKHYLPGALIAVAVSLAALAVRSRLLWRRVAAIALAGSIVLPLLVAPLFGELLQAPIRDAALAARAIGAPVVQWKTHWPSFSVYLGAETPLRAPGPGEVAVTRADRLPEAGRLDVLYRQGGVALVTPSGSLASNGRRSSAEPGR